MSRQQQLNEPLLTDSNIDNLIIDERNNDMVNLSHDLLQLREAMQDMNQLVVEQGEGLQTIHKQTEDSKVTMTIGVDELRKAKRYQNRSRRKCVVLALILLGVVAAIVVIILVVLKVIKK
eukprot:TRINITY_DN3156_c0_g1_i1.p1 TRINITY_DN3156_c0_g1~~TRINITY_DN3156_c0_g1_i1.p1  ORF type:complete len:120 (-),score=1.51 TRINITY_DN3156_c0_g1_i1:26-385(-)